MFNFHWVRIISEMFGNFCPYKNAKGWDGNPPWVWLFLASQVFDRQVEHMQFLVQVKLVHFLLKVIWRQMLSFAMDFPLLLHPWYAMAISSPLFKKMRHRIYFSSNVSWKLNSFVECIPFCVWYHIYLLHTVNHSHIFPIKTIVKVP